MYRTKHGSFRKSEIFSLFSVGSMNGIRKIAGLFCLVVTRAPFHFPARFPFRIVKATLRLEVQMEWIDVGGDRVVFLCPDLWCPDIKTPGLSGEDIENLLKKVVIVQQPGYLGRSRRLTLLHERPTVQVKCNASSCYSLPTSATCFLLSRALIPNPIFFVTSEAIF